MISKEQCDNILTELQFSTSDNIVFTKTIKRVVGQMIVNGKSQQQVQEIPIEVKYLGICYEIIDEKDQEYGQQWSINKNMDVIISDEQEFRKILQFK
jgi:hypothetical protein